MKKLFLVILIIGFLVLLGIYSKAILNKINSSLFQATLVPFSPAFEELEPEISEIGSEDLLLEETKTLAEPEPLPAEDSAGGAVGGPEMNLEEIQEILDDIAERVDEISQQVSDLIEGLQPVLEQREVGLEMESELEGVGQDRTEEEGREKIKERTKEKTEERTGRAGGGASPTASYPKILISEIQISPIEERFIELYNPNNQDVNLTNWYIQRKTETGTSWDSLVSSTKFEGKSIQPSSHFLIARTSIANADILLEDLTLTEDNVILLKNPNREIVDKVGWGQAQDFETAPAENPAASKSLGRKWNSEAQEHQDTDNNQTDFEIQNPSPKTQNQSAEPELELEPEPDTTPPQVIFNLEPVQTSLSFMISWTAIDPIGNTTPSGLDGLFLQYSIPNIETTSPSQDGIGLWYKDNEEWNDWISTQILELSEEKNNLSLLGKNEYTYSFQIKAKDKAGNESNWQTAETKISLPKIVLINEIQIDSQEGVGGADDDWVELYNPNDWGIDLSQWSIQRSPKSGTIYKKNFELGDKIPSKGYFLIVRNQASQKLLDIADMTCSALQLSSDSTVYLVKNQEEIENGQDPDIVDKIGFGELSFSPEGNPALNPPEVKSIERKELGLDTNDNSQDFKINDIFTPTNSKGETISP